MTAKDESAGLLEIKNLVAGYGKLAVLHDVNVSVPKGSLTAVIGPNGAGKTTLMNAILRVVDVMKGEIRFNGSEISHLATNKIAELGIGYVPQGGNVFPSLSVQENMEMSCHLIFKNSSKTKQAIAGAYEMFPRLKQRRSQKASSLSGGERQMLAISTAQMLKPTLLILDEPTTGLAPNLVDEVTNGVVGMKESGGTTMIWVVEENPLQVIAVADWVYVLEGGVVRSRQTGREMLDNPNLLNMFLGS